MGNSASAPAEQAEPLLQQEEDVEAAQPPPAADSAVAGPANGITNEVAPPTRAEEGIVTVVTAAEAAAARNAAAAANKSGDAERSAALNRRAERAARGEADHSLAGLLLYALSTIFMSAMMICVKLLGKWGISVFIVLFIRSMTVLTCALINLAKDRVNPWGNRRKLLTLRGLLGFGGNGGYFWTVTLLPLNDAVVLTFLAPAWVAILSPLLLHERPGRFTYFAIPACILGVCLISRPQLAASHRVAVLHAAGITIGLLQAFFSGTAKMCVRELRSTEAPNVIVFYLAFISSLGALTGIIGQAIFVGRLHPPTTWQQILTCFVVGMLGYGAQISLTYGLRSAKAAPAIATSYLSVVWGILGSEFIFHETPTKESIAGAVIIILSTGLLGYMEKRRVSKPRVPDASVEGQLLLPNGEAERQI